MKQGLLSWSRPCLHTLLPSPLKHKCFTVTANLNSAETQLTSRERRQMRNEKRESKSGYSWKDEVEMRLIQKPKKRYASWMEQLNLDNLGLAGPQWWIVKAARTGLHETADRMSTLLAREFPEFEFKIYVPSVQTRTKLKNGTISVKPKPLFPGCMFLWCVLGKEIHDFIREVDKVGGFVGSKVGNMKRQINLPRAVDEEEMKDIFKKAKIEQEEADKAFEEMQKAEEAASSGKGSDLPVVPEDVTPLNSTAKPRGRGRKSAKQPMLAKVAGLVAGSTVEVKSGSFAGFSGTLKKVNGKTGLVTVAFTLFGKETLADIDADEVIRETAET